MKIKIFTVGGFLLALLFLVSSAAAQEDKPKTINNVGVVNGKAVKLPIPAYPAAARAVNASGAVNVQTIIDEEGNVTSAEAVSGHPLLRAAAEKAALEAKFRPIILSGKAVKARGILIYNFVGDSSKKAKKGNSTDADEKDFILNGRALKLPAPEYPAAAKAVKASGIVKVRVTVDEKGAVIDAATVSGHPLLRSAAEKAAGQAEFEPTLLNGKPAKITGIIVYNFVSPAEKPD